MNPFNPTSWKAWWPWLRSGFMRLGSGPQSLLTDDWPAAPPSAGFEFMEPADLLALHQDQGWGFHSDSVAESGLQDSMHCGESVGDYSHHCDHQDNTGGSPVQHDDAQHHHDHDIFGHDSHGHGGSWDSNNHCSDWGSSWD